MDLNELHITKPTEKLLLLALRQTGVRMTIGDLSRHTFSSPGTLAEAAQRLVKRGLLRRERVGNFAYFSLPSTDFVAPETQHSR